MKQILLAIFICIFNLSGDAQGTFVASFQVDAGEYERFNTPVSISLNSLLSNIDSCYFKLFETTGNINRDLPVQFQTGSESRVWWILEGITSPGELRQFDLFCTAKKDNNYLCKSIINDTNLRLILNGNNVLQYNHSLHYPPEGVDSIYRRSAFIHPLWSPSGNILTRINPPDHYHHLGIWNPWTKAHFRNKEIDFWNLNKGQGTVMYKGYISSTSGDVYAGFRSLHNHVIFQETGNEINILNEEWDVRIWNISIPVGIKVHLVDFLSLLSCATEDSVILDAYRYGGGIGFRAAEEWINNNSWVFTSEGFTRKDADGSRARWVNVGGEFPGKRTSGIVFYSHPSNRDHPQPMRVWPLNSNEGRGDVYFEFCPIRHNRWILEPGKIYSQKYRLLIYDGKIDNLTAERIWNDFACPPEVKIIHKK